MWEATLNSCKVSVLTKKIEITIMNVVIQRLEVLFINVYFSSRPLWYVIFVVAV